MIIDFLFCRAPLDESNFWGSMRNNNVIFNIQIVVKLQKYKGYGALRDRLLEEGLICFEMESTLFFRVRQNNRLL